ncbi:MAG TPA: hypothetical protein VNX65_05215 [Patescibacteria group bacterium]|nr:hypothetical protein [Patescibacteria group bacterium]
MNKRAQFIAVLCGFALVIGGGIPAAAQTEPINKQPALPALIIELQTGSENTTKDKFVVIYNPNEYAMDVTNWQLQYRSASSKSDALWHTKATLNCELVEPAAGQDCQVQIAAHNKLWLASYDLGPDRPSYDLKNSMSAKNGQIRLVCPASEGQPELVQDAVNYGNVEVAAGNKSAPTPPPGKSLKRKIDADSKFINTNNSSSDFFVEGTQEVLPDLSSGLQAVNVAKPDMSIGQPAKIYPTIDITELLPRANTGIADGFIKLYNPHDEQADLQGYVLQTGPAYSHHFTLPVITIAGHGYLSFNTSATRLSLSQKGSAARLLNPNGDVVSTTKPYSAAKPGLAWMQTQDGDWQWTTTPTPNAVSVLIAPSTKPSKSVDKTGITKAQKAQKTPKAAKVKAKDPISPTSLAQTAAQPAKLSANYWLIGAATLVLGYACFEYRQDLLGFVQRVRSKLYKR